jgi:uncharacterized protein (DUF433 family)
MQIEDYFAFLAPYDIRLKGTRIGIETILYDYIFRARTPEEIEKSYTSLTLDQVYATILYYLQNKQAMDEYLTDWIEYGEGVRREQEANPSAGIVRLRELRKRQMAEQNA